MKIYIEISTFSESQAHGAIVITDRDLSPITIVPISMPIQSYETAVENNLLHPEHQPRDSDNIESTIFFSPEEIGRK